MTRLIVLRVAIAAVGLAVWGYGVRADHSTVRLVGIGCFALALMLRFARRRDEAS